jgi:hypothetical protein
VRSAHERIPLCEIYDPVRQEYLDDEAHMSDKQFDFSKFVADIEKREYKPELKQEELTPARRLNILYRELWQNRIVWRGR